MHPTARVIPRTATAALLVVAVAGCGGQIDSDKAEAEIQKGIERQSAGRIPIRSVQCPDGVDLEKGKTFNCTVTGTNGKRGTVTVTQRDDEGNVSFSGNLQALVQR